MAAVLGAAGLLMSAGGQLHPRGKGETVEAYLDTMLGSSTWVVAHTLSLVGMVVAVAGLAMARRISAFGPGVDRILTITTVAWGIAAIEAVPHLLAVRDHASLQHDEATPILDLHLLLAIGATPLFGFTGALLALAVAREAGTVPSKLLAVLAVIGGLCYGAAGPLISLVDDVAVAPLFIGQAGLAIWVLGTAVRLAFGKGHDDGDAVTAEPTGTDESTLRRPLAGRCVPSRPRGRSRGHRIARAADAPLGRLGHARPRRLDLLRRRGRRRQHPHRPQQLRRVGGAAAHRTRPDRAHARPSSPDGHPRRLHAHRGASTATSG